MEHGGLEGMNVQSDWDLVPAAAELTAAAGSIPLPQGLRLQVAQPAAGERTRALAARYQRRIDHLLGRPPAAAAHSLTLQAGQTAPWPGPEMAEGFELSLAAGGSRLEAPSHWGLVQGLERLLQLVRPGVSELQLPAGRLRDRPRLPWRGLLLDLARHFLGLPALLRTLDAMAAAGLNVLHLHLNDDQGFALEMPRRPLLHQLSAPGGHLSVADARTLVSEAALRGIRVVPELDVPGHAGAILHAYPELAIGGAPDRLPRAFGQTRGALNPSLDATWSFLDAVLADLCEIFPDPCLHIGGDEVHPQAFLAADQRQRDWMAAHGLADPAAVQTWFLAELAGRLRQRGRRAIAWDEALHEALPRDIIIQCWRGSASLQAAVNAGHDALFSAGYYLDLNYPAAWHYRFAPDAGPDALARAEAALRAEPEIAPLADALQALQRAAAEVQPASVGMPGRVLGGEGCLWGELVDAQVLDRRLHSRLAAVAERLWMPAAATPDFGDLARRLPGWLAHLEAVSDCRPLTLPGVALRRWGVLPAERPALMLLFDALAPVRWYQRLLGPAAVARRLGAAVPAEEGAGRPYDADTPLSAPVDQVCPDSLTALQLEADLGVLARALAVGQNNNDAARAEASARLRVLARDWQALPESLAPLLQRSAELAPLVTRVDELAELGEVLLAWLEALPVSPDDAMTPAGARLHGARLHGARLHGARLQALIAQAGPPRDDLQLAVLPPLLGLLEASAS